MDKVRAYWMLFYFPTVGSKFSLKKRGYRLPGMCNAIAVRGFLAVRLYVRETKRLLDFRRPENIGPWRVARSKYECIRMKPPSVRKLTIS